MKSHHFLLISFFTLLTTQAICQEDQQTDSVYTDFEEALKHPEDILNLDLSNQSITFEPGVFELFTNLEYLSLKNEHLTTIPAGIMKLKKLRTLDLSGNDFTVLPNNFGNLTNLEQLYLNDEKNMQLDPTLLTLSRLPNLRELHLENDHIVEIPKNLGELKHLQTLYLNDNDLTTIPMYMENLEGLDLLDLRNNRITPTFQFNYHPSGNTLIKF